MLFNDTKEEVAFDLDNNKPIENNYLVVPNKLNQIVVNLRKNGFNVISCFYPDRDHIYLKDSMVETNLKDIDSIKEEGKQNGEYRRVCYLANDKAIYESYTPNNYIYIDFSKDVNLPSIPEGYELIEMEDRYRLRVMLNLKEENLSYFGDDRPNGLFIDHPSKELDSLTEWTRTVIGHELEMPQSQNKDSYGNSYFIIDPVTNEELNTTYMFCDTLMVPTIASIREKGYKTLGCCSGHFDNIFIQNTGVFPLDSYLMPITVWIVFSTDTPIPYLPEGMNAENVSHTPTSIWIGYQIQIKREDGLYKTSDELKQEVIKANQKMLEWAQSLPKVEEPSLL